VGRPRDLFGRILALVSETPSALPFSGDRTMVLGPDAQREGESRPFPYGADRAPDG